MTLPPNRWAELAQQVYEALEDEGAQPLREVAAEAPQGVERFSELETSLSEWSFGYGVAWALARAREPFASSRRISELATEATAAAWRSFGDPWRALIAADRGGRAQPAPSPEPRDGPESEEVAPQERVETPDPELGDFMSGLARARARRPREREQPPDAT